MKKLFLIIPAFLLITCFVYAQQYEDVVYLKNGGIVHGTIIEQVPNVSVKIKTKDGNVFVYTTEEIQKMTKEEINTGDNEETQYSNTKSKKITNRFNLCVYGGMNFANLSLDPSPNLSTSNISLWHFGVTGDLNWGEYFRNSTYFEICRRGCNDAFDVNGAYAVIDYFNIENAFKAGSFSSNVKPYALVSVVLGFKIGANGYYQGQSSDISSDIKGLDFGLSFGGGVEVPLSKSIALVPEIKYYLGISDINDDQTQTHTIKNNGFQINAGIKFYF